MAFNISYVYEIVDKASRPIRKLVKSQQAFTMAAKSAKAMAEKVARGLLKLRDAAKSAGAKMQSLGKSMTMKVTAPIGIFAGLALRASANLETLQTSFESMLGSADKAREITQRLVEFTAKTPFQLEGVGASAKQLLAFGVTSKDIIPTLNVLGDIAAGANVPLTDMAAIFGKVKAKGKAYTEELLQLSDRGIPIIDVLAKKFGISKQAIFDAAAAGKISFKVIQGALEDMTAQGGIFNNQMERQSRTLAGLFSTLKDNIFLALGEIGGVLVETFDLKQVMKDIITGIGAATKAFRAFVTNNPKLAKFSIILVSIAAVMGPLLVMLGFLVSAVGAISLPVVAVIAGVAALIALFAALSTESGFLSGIWTQLSDVFGDIVAVFGRLFGALGPLGNLIASVFGDGAGFIDVFAQTIRVVLTPLIAVIELITALANADFTSISSIADAVGGALEKTGQFLVNAESAAPEIKAPGAQEVTGQVGVNINLAGQTDAVESVSARQTGGNLGMNMAVAQ